MKLEEKKKAINELLEKQICLIKKVIKINKLPPGKRPSTETKRAARIIAISIEACTINTELQVISTQKVND